ncbi:MAG TPA: hypothetical protein VGR13_05615, partial [Actinomycetota bacterium]|nr:hypothetical protein [Actinomycetota bacterium]
MDGNLSGAQLDVKTRDREGQQARTASPRADRRGSAGRRIMWVLLAVGFIALPFLSASGKYVF